MSRPTLNVVGPGRAAGTLARALAEAGLVRLSQVLASAPSTSRDAADKLGGEAATVETLRPADWWLFGVPDDRLAEVIDDVATHCGPVEGLAFHLSGATPTQVLARVATHRATLHPVRSFPRWLPAAALAGVHAGIGGTPGASAVLTAACTTLGMHPFPLPETGRAGYHAACSIASNYAVTLAATARDAFSNAGLAPELGADLTVSLLGQAIGGVAEHGAERALTGPIVRGDAGTLAAQLAGLDVRQRALFEALAKATIEMAARGGRISASDARALSTVLAHDD